MLLRKLAARLPFSLQQEIRRLRALAAIRRGRFASGEPEFQLLPRLVHPGDWVLDIGANIGEYTLRYSELVGPAGRVFAVEPIAATVEILASVVRCAPHDNVTILNLAGSDAAGVFRFELPPADSGLPNYRQAQMSETGSGKAYSTKLDELAFPHRIAMVKIDVEGHEARVLDGLSRTLERDHPILLIEGHEGLIKTLSPLGYRLLPRQPQSPNILFLPEGAKEV